MAGNVFRRKVTKSVPKPVQGHFGDSPEFVSKPEEPTKPPNRLVKKRPLKEIVKIRA